MLIAVLFYLLNSIISSLAIGALCFLLWGDRLIQMGYRKGILLLLIICALVDLLVLPVVLELDVFIKIGNSQILSLFGLQEDYFPAKEFFSFGWLDIITWLLQAAVAYFGGQALYLRAMRRSSVQWAGEPKRDESSVGR